ncbi:MAG: molybdenum cofactor guanylyltransferase [Dehalococcoidia bacterium]|nr:molybdenum cofactor guanylyltransferase [Dehalococcoidia bacterium]
MTGIVLAGGRGLRLGRPKALEVIGGGDSLLSRVVSRLKVVCSEIIVVTTEDQTRDIVLSRIEASVVSDIIPNRGPLGGLYTGLQHSKNELNIAVACDMPFLNAGLLNYLVSLTPGWDIVAPRINGLTEQLHTVYTKKCAGAANQLVRLGRCRVADLFLMLKTRYVDEPELRKYDPELISFFNINTEADLSRARTLIGWEALTGGKDKGVTL